MDTPGGVLFEFLRQLLVRRVGRSIILKRAREKAGNTTRRSGVFMLTRLRASGFALGTGLPVPVDATELVFAVWRYANGLRYHPTE